MKWIEIEKAKPKFKTKYLCFNDGEIFIGVLASSKHVEAGIYHEFDNDVMGKATPATHIALITSPLQPLNNG